jgi:hypothetical protein
MNCIFKPSVEAILFGGAMQPGITMPTKVFLKSITGKRSAAFSLHFLRPFFM